MPKLSETGAMQYDDPNAGVGGLGYDIHGWAKDRNLIGFPINILSRTTRHVEDKYLPSGDFIKEHDEIVFAFSFAVEDDPRILEVFPEYTADQMLSETTLVYGCSTRAARILRVFEHLADDDFPLECVILSDETKKYNPLYLADPITDGGSAETPQASTSHGQAATPQTHPTTGGTPNGGSARAQTGGRWQTPSGGGQQPTGTNPARATKAGGR